MFCFKQRHFWGIDIMKYDHRTGDIRNQTWEYFSNNNEQSASSSLTKNNDKPVGKSIHDSLNIRNNNVKKQWRTWRGAYISVQVVGGVKGNRTKEIVDVSQSLGWQEIQNIRRNIVRRASSLIKLKAKRTQVFLFSNIHILSVVHCTCRQGFLPCKRPPNVRPHARP